MHAATLSPFEHRGQHPEACAVCHPVPELACRCEVREPGQPEQHVVTDDCPQHGLTPQERARYYEAIDCGATHDDAMEAAGGY